MSERTNEEIRDAVRERYASLADGGVSWMEQAADEPAGSAADAAVGCCGAVSSDAHSKKLGYSAKEQQAVPEGANLGLGCGNPQAIAGMQAGETALDLGSGAGFDCFLAAAQVGPAGRVIGVDMTHEMLHKARVNADKGEFSNVEFRLGEIEHLPVADNTVDVIISNCVINLSPDKQAVFDDAFRVLKPGGRLAISDVVATVDLPQQLRDDMSMLSGCISGAAQVEELAAMLAGAGFEEIRIEPKSKSREFIKEWAPGGKIEDYVQSATIEAIKPI